MKMRGALIVIMEVQLKPWITNGSFARMRRNNHLFCLKETYKFIGTKWKLFHVTNFEIHNIDLYYWASISIKSWSYFSDSHWSLRYSSRSSGSTVILRWMYRNVNARVWDIVNDIKIFIQHLITVIYYFSSDKFYNFGKYPRILYCKDNIVDRM